MRARLLLCSGLVAMVALTGCAQLDIIRIAGDDTAGRNNNTPGSALARSYLLGELKANANGLDSSQTGDAAYIQTFPSGTNLLAVIPGTDLADQYVMVGAHYDHLGSGCRTSVPADTICNGATDNAAGVAALLGIARAIKAQATPPRRSVILAIWDREEDGLLGSQYYVQHPVVPLAKTTSYVNFDIQGSNLLPSLRNTSIAVAAETGGTRFQDIVRSAIGEQSLDTTLFSSIFGQFRSDYANLIGAGVPSVFFTDSTGPCYHTAQDEFGVVDFYKLDQQIQISLAVTRELANTSTPPAFVAERATGHLRRRPRLLAAAEPGVLGQGPLLGRRPGDVRAPARRRAEARGRGAGGVRLRRREPAADRRGRGGHAADPRLVRRLPGSVAAGGGAQAGDGPVGDGPLHRRRSTEATLSSSVWSGRSRRSSSFSTV